MNTNLIAVDFQTVVPVRGDARVLLRDVWKKLGSKRLYRNWADYYLPGFQENVEFGVFNTSVNNLPQGGRPTIDHWVTVDTAKQIAMMQQTETGKTVRRYFLECERLVYKHFQPNSARFLIADND